MPRLFKAETGGKYILVPFNAYIINLIFFLFAKQTSLAKSLSQAAKPAFS